MSVDRLEAFAKAPKIDDILPMMAASRRAQMEKTPADEREMMFGMLKEMTAKDATGAAAIVKEGGVWKLDKESWTSK